MEIWCIRCYIYSIIAISILVTFVHKYILNKFQGFEFKFMNKLLVSMSWKRVKFRIFQWLPFVWHTKYVLYKTRIDLFRISHNVSRRNCLIRVLGLLVWEARFDNRWVEGQGLLLGLKESWIWLSQMLYCWT